MCVDCGSHLSTCNRQGGQSPHPCYSSSSPIEIPICSHCTFPSFFSVFMSFTRRSADRGLPEGRTLSMVSELTVGSPFITDELPGGDPNITFSDPKFVAGLSAAERIDIKCDRLESGMIALHSLIESRLRSFPPIAFNTSRSEIRDIEIKFADDLGNSTPSVRIAFVKEIEANAIADEAKGDDLAIGSAPYISFNGRRSRFCDCRIKIAADPSLPVIVEVPEANPNAEANGATPSSLTDDLGVSIISQSIADEEATGDDLTPILSESVTINTAGDADAAPKPSKISVVAPSTLISGLLKSRVHKLELRLAIEQLHNKAIDHCGDQIRGDKVLLSVLVAASSEMKAHNPRAPLKPPWEEDRGRLHLRSVGSKPRPLPKPPWPEIITDRAFDLRTDRIWMGEQWYQMSKLLSSQHSDGKLQSRTKSSLQSICTVVEESESDFAQPPLDVPICHEYDAQYVFDNLLQGCEDIVPEGIVSLLSRRGLGPPIPISQEEAYPVVRRLRKSVNNSGREVAAAVKQNPVVANADGSTREAHIIQCKPEGTIKFSHDSAKELTHSLELSSKERVNAYAATPTTNPKVNHVYAADSQREFTHGSLKDPKKAGLNLDGGFEKNKLSKRESMFSLRHQVTIVWLHGLGDNESSWSQLLETLSLQNVNWICPTAPTRPVAVFGGFPCTAWFDVGKLSEEGPDDVEGMDASASHIANRLSTEPTDVKLGVGGFSMGAAMALYSATCCAYGRFGNGNPYPVNISAVVGLSGWLPCSRTLRSKVESSQDALRRAASLPDFMCHGRGDDVVLYKHGEKSAEVLRSSGFRYLTFKTYNGLGRYTVPEEMDNVCKWFTARLGLEGCRINWEFTAS